MSFSTSSGIAPPSIKLQRQLTGAADLSQADGGFGAALAAAALAAPTSSGTVGFVQPPAEVYDFRIAGVTDAGVVGKQNQDDFFIWEAADRQTIIAGVFDGHGREMGQAAARVAKTSLRDELSKPETLARLRASPKATLEAAFAAAHRAIDAHFQASYEGQGWTVTRAPEGFLLRTRAAGGAPMCVHGGTTATVLIVLDGRRLIVSNVGDSTAIIAGLGTEGALRPIDEWVPTAGGAPVGLPPASTGASQGAGASALGGAGSGSAAGAAGEVSPSLPPIAAVPSTFGAVAGAPATSSCSYSAPEPLSAGAAAYVPVPAAVASSYMELSADHSPESPSEFRRMQRFRPSPSGEDRPELLFVYDTLSASKLACPSIFAPAPGGAAGLGAGGEAALGLVKTERGAYYKNVRCEWATLVATPPTASFQDALAFTRSLGDLHLQAYGVSHEPETWWMELTAPGMSAAAAARGGCKSLVSHPTAIVLASDGIWDNWKFEEVAAFALQPERLARVGASGTALAATAELMAENLDRGHANFGSSADNMTALTLYLFPRDPRAE